jgi:hypothetical protein
MNRTDGFEKGQSVTTGEKALIVMLIAGVFGYWAAFKVLAPGDIVGMPVATAAAMFVVAPPKQTQVGPGAASKAPVEKNLRVSAASKDAVSDDVPAPTF